MASGRRREGAALLLLLAGLAVAQAYPTLFVARIADSCTSHPRMAHMGGRGAGHLAPVKDDTVKFELSAGGRPVAKLCPGAATALKVTFSAPRYGLLTSTVGTFAEGDPWDCANRVILDKQRAAVHTTTLTVPCRGNPASTLIEVTSSNGEGLAFKQATLTVPIDASCAAQSCGSQGKAASG